jgi:BRCT domain type II-containing protein
VGSISGKTSFILAGDNMGPSKLQKAEKLGVQIVSEDEFLSMIEGGTSVENNTSVPPTSAETKPTTPIQLDLFS